jgi:hypothetical protein
VTEIGSEPLVERQVTHTRLQIEPCLVVRREEVGFQPRSRAA